MRGFLWFCFFYVLSLSACKEETIENEMFSSEKWKSDKLGCLGNRLRLRQGLLSQQDQIKGLTESQVISILGRPNRIDLFKRGQKFFVYLVNNPNCMADTTLPPMQVEIRFNSLDISSEVSLIQSPNAVR